jgi:hypothetical protein
MQQFTKNFTFELAECEVPVVAPLARDGENPVREVRRFSFRPVPAPWRPGARPWQP